MTLDETTLAETLQRREHYVDLQVEADDAKRRYHDGIRRLHAAGGSLREIADALGVSHQLVHQIVDNAERPAPPTTVIRCTFCDRSQKDVKKLIAGPGVYICEECVGLARPVAHGEADQVSKGDVTLRSVRSPSALRCSFCKKKVSQVVTLVSRDAVHICDECHRLCEDILAEGL